MAMNCMAMDERVAHADIVTAGFIDTRIKKVSQEGGSEKKKLFACRALWAEWSGRCLLRVHCRCAALLVLC
jgi:hypothetical protein